MLVAVFRPLKHRSVVHIYGDVPVCSAGPLAPGLYFFFTFVDTVASGIRWFLSAINSFSVSRGFAALQGFFPLYESVIEFSFSVCLRR